MGQWIVDIGAWIAAGGTIVAALIAIWRKVLRPLKMRISSIWQLPGAVSTMMEQNQTMLKGLEVLRKELVPNGGSSLRDAVDRTEKKQALITGLVRAIYDHEATGRVEANPAGGLAWANRMFLRWTGRSLEEVLNFGWIACIAMHDRERVREEWELCVAETREFSMEFSMAHSDGTMFMVVCVAIPIRGWGGKVEGWLGTIRRVEINGGNQH